jgi:hypothetical protein
MKATAERRSAMRSGPLGLKGLLPAGFVFACVLLPCLAAAEPALVQTTGNNGLVFVRRPPLFPLPSPLPPKYPYFFSIQNAAIIHVLVTNPVDGAPIANLGTSVGDWGSIIALPTGWTLQPLSGPYFCGQFSPMKFENLGNGVYRIYVLPQNSLFCQGWLPGDYVYRVEINNPNGTTFRGSGMGLFEIPVSP